MSQLQNILWPRSQRGSLGVLPLALYKYPVLRASDQETPTFSQSLAREKIASEYNDAIDIIADGIGKGMKNAK